MIRDNETILTTAVGFDLGGINKGPGEPIVMTMVGGAASTEYSITDGVDKATAEAGTGPCTSFVTDAAGFAEFRLPSNVKQWIACTFAQGTLQVALEGNQTAK